MKKLVATVWCVVFLLLSLSGCSGQEAVSTTEDGFTTRFNPDTGTLTVSGEGALTDCYPRTWEWAEYWRVSEIVEENQTIKTLILEEGITKIDNCFNDLLMLEKVEIPSTLKSICRSFMHCTALRKIRIPATVKSIWDHSFNDCSRLSDIQFEGKIEICDSRDDLILPVFKNLESLKKIVIPDKSVLCQAFNDCYNLESITLGKMVSCHGIYRDSHCMCRSSFDLAADYESEEYQEALKKRTYYIHEPCYTGGLDGIDEGIKGLSEFDEVEVKKIVYIPE